MDLTNFLKHRDMGSIVFEADGNPSKTEINNFKNDTKPDKLGAVDNSAVVKIDRSQMSINEKRLYMKFKTHDDFFIVGKAGWGKTSIIRDMAKKFGYEIVLFSLDKAEATDLGGMPVPIKDDKTGKMKMEQLPPTFANKIIENPKQKFLLFFDEMNQAAPDVLNALMPIVLEHVIAGYECPNILVGAAGNYADENVALSELSKPLESRFKPLIDWQTGGDVWESTFRFLHSKWDSKIGKDIVDAYERNCELFNNPRELEQKILDRSIYTMIQDKDNFDADEWLDQLSRTVKNDLSRTEEKQLKELAEFTHDAVEAHNTGKTKAEADQGTRFGNKKNEEQIPEELVDYYKQGVKTGYISVPYEDKDGKTKYKKYGVSAENIRKIQSELNAEQLERLLNKFSIDGIKFKFQKDDEWRKAGYDDPLAEDERDAE